jgi:hypothetical protein
MQGYELLTPQFIVLAFGTVSMVLIFCCVRSQQSRLIMALVFVATVLAIIASMVVEFRL